MAATLSLRAWHCVMQFTPFTPVGAVSKLASYIYRNFRHGDEDWQLDVDYMDSEGVKILSGIYSLDESVNAVFSKGAPITLADVAHGDGNSHLLSSPKALIDAIIQVCPERDTTCILT